MFFFSVQHGQSRFLGPKIVTRQLFSLRYLNLGILIIRKQLQGAADVAAIGAAHVLGG